MELEIELEEQKRAQAESASSDKNSLLRQKEQWGKEFGFELAASLQGIYSEAVIGIVFPKIGNMFSFGLRGVFAGSITEFVYFDKTDSELIKYSRIASGGTLWFGCGSPLLFNFIRFYGLAEAFFGTTVSFGVEYGPNFTFGAFGFGGIEFYTTRWSAVFIEAGGGWMNIFGAAGNVYIEEDGWKGSGFGIKLGTRIYLAKKAK